MEQFSAKINWLSVDEKWMLVTTTSNFVSIEEALQFARKLIGIGCFRQPKSITYSSLVSLSQTTLTVFLMKKGDYRETKLALPYSQLFNAIALGWCIS